jgi:hypothetical protein
MNPDGSGLRPLTSFDGYAPDFTASGVVQLTFDAAGVENRGPD